MGNMTNTGDVGDISTEGPITEQTERAEFTTGPFTCLDLEMNQPSGKIIQVGAAVGNLLTGDVYERLRIYVQIDEPLDARISTLCRITQEQLNTGTSLIDAYRQVAQLHTRHQSFVNAVTWGGDDTGELQKQVWEKI